MMELLVTVIIVGILAAIALPNFGKAIEKAKVKDAETALAAIASAERVYRLDQGDFGSLADLTSNHYVSDPDAGNSNTDWDFEDSNVPAGTFTITAKRTGGGYDGAKVKVDQAYTGGPVYGGKIYDGDHILRD